MKAEVISNDPMIMKTFYSLRNRNKNYREALADQYQTHINTQYSYIDHLRAKRFLENTGVCGHKVYCINTGSFTCWIGAANLKEAMEVIESL